MNIIRALIIRTVIIGAAALMGANLSYQRWIAPLEAHRAESARELAKLNDRVQSARQEIWEIEQRGQNTAGLRRSLSALHQNLPADAPIVWLPPRLQTALSGLGIAESKVQLYQTSPEPALPGYKSLLWHVAVPQQPGLSKVTDALLAVAQIEQQDHFITIQDLAFHAESPEPGRITGFVNFTAFLPESQN